MKKGKIIIAVVITFVITALLFFGAYLFILPPKTTVSIGLLDEVEAYLGHYYYEDVDLKSAEQAAAKALCDSADEYTTYYSPEEYENFISSTQGKYTGVGIVIGKNTAGNIVVVMPYEDAPGAEAGVKIGDIILKVDGKEYNGDALTEAANAMRGGDGTEGTSVVLTIKRGEEIFDLTVTRREVNLKTVSGEIINSNIGYVRIISFDNDTDAEFEDMYNKLKADGAEKFILDLRDNGGGDYNVACSLAGKFIEEGKMVVYAEYKNGEKKYEFASGKICDEPVIMLVNENSASASEVLCGSLKANGRLKEIIGKKTFGKGIMQVATPLKNGGGMTVTIARYFVDEGVCIHGIGIEPTIDIESGYPENYPSTAYEYEKDIQLLKAIEIYSK